MIYNVFYFKFLLRKRTSNLYVTPTIVFVIWGIDGLQKQMTSKLIRRISQKSRLPHIESFELGFIFVQLRLGYELPNPYNGS